MRLIFMSGTRRQKKKHELLGDCHLKNTSNRQQQFDKSLEKEYKKTRNYG